MQSIDERKIEMLTIAQIAALTLAGGLGQLSDQALTDASQSVMFAIDPAHMGEEPHLVHHVDACGLGEDDLHRVDQAIWAELAIREDLRWQAMDDSRRAAMQAFALPLAA